MILIENDYIVRIGLSVGVVVVLNDGIDLEYFVVYFDVVFYCVKDFGCGCYVFFEDLFGDVFIVDDNDIGG